MRKSFLTYTFLIVFCLIGTGCASSISSSRVGIGQNIRHNTPIKPERQIQNPVNQSYKLFNDLVYFINHYNKRISVNEARSIADAIIKMSNKYKVNYKIVTALVAVESGFNAKARSPSGALGLAQLMPGTARGLRVRNPFNPYDNLNGAVSLLRSHLEKYNGDINFALAAYKMGSGTVSRRGISQPSTIRYIKKVRSIFDAVP